MTGTIEAKLPDYFAERQAERQALHAALCLFQSKVAHPEKTRKGQIGNREFWYADLADNMDVVQPLLEECGLAVSQTFENGDDKLFLVTALLHREGGERLSKFPLDLRYDDPKAIGAYLQYMRRYNLQAILGLSSSDIDLDETDTGDLKVKTLTEKQQVQLRELVKEKYPDDDADEKLSHLGKRLYKEEDLAKWPQSDLQRVTNIIIKNAPKKDEDNQG